MRTRHIIVTALLLTATLAAAPAVQAEALYCQGEENDGDSQANHHNRTCYGVVDGSTVCTQQDERWGTTPDEGPYYSRDRGTCLDLRDVGIGPLLATPSGTGDGYKLGCEEESGTDPDEDGLSSWKRESCLVTVLAYGYIVCLDSEYEYTYENGNRESDLEGTCMLAFQEPVEVA